MASALVASVSQAGVAAAAVGVVSAAAGPICGKTVPVIFLFFKRNKWTDHIYHTERVFCSTYV